MLSDSLNARAQASWLVVNPGSVVSSGPNSARPNGPSTPSTGNPNSGTNGGGVDGTMACDI